MSPPRDDGSSRRRIRSTTVICVRRNGQRRHGRRRPGHAGRSVIKHSAKKIRRLYQDKILAGFAGSTADAFSLFQPLRSPSWSSMHGNLGRAAVELAKDWRTDKMLRHLEALLVVADKEQTFLLSGSGDVIEPDEGDRRHRQRRQLRPGGGAGAAREHRSAAPARSPKKAMRIAGANLHLHQRPDHD